MEKKKQSNILTVVACLVVMFSIGIVYLWSVFQGPATQHYVLWDSASARMLSSIMIFMFIFGNMIGGFLQDKWSPRFVILFGAGLFFAGLFLTSLLGVNAAPWTAYITYGAVAGCGVGFAYAGSLNCIQKWFPHRRGFASGLSVCAFGLSAVVLAPLSEKLLVLPAFGDNAVPLTFRTIAIVFTVLIVIAGLFVKNPKEEYLKSLNLPAKHTNQKQYTPGEVVKTAPFWCLVLTVFFLPSVFFILNPLVKTLAVFREIPAAQASLTISLSGIVQAVSRLLCGIVSDKIGRARTVFIIAVLSLIAAILITFVTGWFYTVVVWLIFFVYAGPSSIYPAMATDAYGTKHSGGNYGIALIFLGISSPVFTIISNQINADGAVTGDYTTSFVLAACVCIVPLVALPLFDMFKKRMQKKEAENQV